MVEEFEGEAGGRSASRTVGRMSRETNMIRV
jgi:hypothetical protein